MRQKIVHNTPEYSSIHAWIRYHYGKAYKCTNKKCKATPKRFDYALKHGKKYERNINNFIQLCRSCHFLYDWTPSRSKNMAKSSAGASKTHCKRGHPYNKENTIHGKRRANKLSIFKEYKIRICKACYKLCLEKIERNRTPEEKARIVQKRREKYLEKKRLLQTSL